ncbi:hypothetical protein DS745_23090 [Anaerobacillus alkaliphilus]|uniref:Uncharacterized protein n=1 Tax=Anaerobacillus alkaliphilus TaxID=1548597 RepID=A0A4Q0VMM4_9BACI|nr:hypothetical protein DS745_23090 [Anaerobacillus alkaliphilus]
MDVIFVISFKLVWLALFYGILHLFHKALFQKGFYIAQLLFLSYFLYSQSKMIDRFTILSINEMVVIWFTASAMFLYSVFEKQKS